MLTFDDDLFDDELFAVGLVHFKNSQLESKHRGVRNSVCFVRYLTGNRKIEGQMRVLMNVKSILWLCHLCNDRDFQQFHIWKIHLLTFDCFIDSFL